MRKTLFKLHSYFALVALVPLMIVSVTGSILVFKAEIDQWLMPEVAALPYTDKAMDHFVRKNHNQLQETIEERFPDYIIGSWEMFYDGREADRVYLIKKGTDDWYKIFFDPFVGVVLSEPVELTSYLTDFLLSLHYTFLLNGVGSEDSQWGTFVGLLAAMILTFLGVSGLIIYRKFWLQLFQLRIKKSARVIAGDLHRFIGVWSSPVVLVLGITGIYFNAVEYYHEVFEHTEEEHYHPTENLYSGQLDFQFILEDSKRQLDGFTPTYLLYPFEPEVSITVFGYLPSANPFASHYASTVTYDRSNGELLSAVNGQETGVANQVFDSFRKLHFGSFAGVTSKVIWSLLGLAPLFLAITGLTVWLLRNNKRSKKKARREGRPLPA